MDLAGANPVPASRKTPAPLLQIRDLHTHFQTPAGTARAVDGVSLHVEAGEVLGIVGESGCGKSVLALSVLRLLPMPPAVFAGGEIIFRGRNLLNLPEWEIRTIRGNEISMIFQEPMTALNPVFTRRQSTGGSLPHPPGGVAFRSLGQGRRNARNRRACPFPGTGSRSTLTSFRAAFASG